SPDLSDIESELYDIISTIMNLYHKNENGLINQNFFHKSIQNNYKKLRNINLLLKNKNIPITSFIKETNFVKEYNTALQIINEFTSKKVSISNLVLKSKNKSEFAERLKKSVLDLPSVTSEITSSFITLMDSIKLCSRFNQKLILKFFNELKLNLQKLPEFEAYMHKIKKIESHVRKNFDLLIKSNDYKEKVVNHIYNIYQEFQNELRI
ncbi:MAG: hypothetical protein P8Y70_13095, partial [Candidatus Lokiarchaeota archaeon]